MFSAETKSKTINFIPLSAQIEESNCLKVPEAKFLGLEYFPSVLILSNSLIGIIASALKTKEGQIAFKLIKKLSLWDEASVNTSAEGELYKRGRRDIWLMIRQYIPKKILAQIEIFDEFKLEEL